MTTLNRDKNKDVTRDLNVAFVNDNTNVYRKKWEDHHDRMPNKNCPEQAVTCVPFGKPQRVRAGRARIISRPNPWWWYIIRSFHTKIIYFFGKYKIILSNARITDYSKYKITKYRLFILKESRGIRIVSVFIYSVHCFQIGYFFLLYIILCNVF